MLSIRERCSGFVRVGDQRDDKWPSNHLTQEAQHSRGGNFFGSDFCHQPICRKCSSVLSLVITNAHQRRPARFAFLVCFFPSAFVCILVWWIWIGLYLPNQAGRWKQWNYLCSQGCRWRPILASGGWLRYQLIVNFCLGRWTWPWTLETGRESRSGVERTQGTSGFTSTRCPASIGSPFPVGCQ